MSTLKVTDADGNAVYLKASGVGSSGDPLVLERSGAVTVSSSALPSGAATAANQATANTSLSTIAGRLPVEGDAADYLTVRLTDGSAFYSASGGGGGGGSTTIADGDDAALGATTDSAASTDTGTATLIALIKRLLSRLTTLLPQSSGRLSVGVGATVLASDAATATNQAAQTTLLGGGLPSALASDRLKVEASDGGGSITVDGPLTDAQLRATALPISAASLPLPSGAATATNQTAAATLTGAVDETAPASDTASSGLNGRLQRIAQRLTSLIALLPTSLGQKARAASLAVTLSSEDVTALSPAALLTESTFSTRVPAPKTLLYASIAASSSGDNQLVAAVTGQRIYVAALWLSVSGAVNAKLRSASTDISGLLYGTTAGNGIVLPNAAPGYWARTAVGEALNLNLSGATAVGGTLIYWTE
jgi:hypothetical protein